MRHVAIVADADACVPAGMRRDLGILTAPRDAPLLERLESVAELSRTAAPLETAEVVDACLAAAREAPAVFYLSTPGSPPDGATHAQEALEGRGVAFAHRAAGSLLMAGGWQAVAAATVAVAGENLARVCAAAEWLDGRVSLLAMLEQPALLDVGGLLAGLGRRRAVARLVGEEVVEVVARVARRDQALVALRDHFGELAAGPDATGARGPLHVAVHHAASGAAADAMARWAERELAPHEVVTSALTRSAASRFGPGMLALAWYRER